MECKAAGEKPAVLQDLYNGWYNGETIPQLMNVRTAVTVTAKGFLWRNTQQAMQSKKTE